MSDLKNYFFPVSCLHETESLAWRKSPDLCLNVTYVVISENVEKPFSQFLIIANIIVWKIK
jgi:hypothetical protein